MTSMRTGFYSMLIALGLLSCGSPGIPDPIKVMENPTTGQRVRFFREIPFKVPSDYDESKHLEKWTATQAEAGFTREIPPEDDREALVQLRRKNLEASQKSQK